MGGKVAEPLTNSVGLINGLSDVSNKLSFDLCQPRPLLSFGSVDPALVDIIVNFDAMGGEMAVPIDIRHWRNPNFKVCIYSDVFCVIYTLKSIGAGSRG